MIIRYLLLASFSLIAPSHAQVNLSTLFDSAYCVGVKQEEIEFYKETVEHPTSNTTVKRSAELSIQKLHAEIEQAMIVLRAYSQNAPSHVEALNSMIKQGRKDQLMCYSVISKCPVNNNNDFHNCWITSLRDYCSSRLKMCR